MFNRQNFVKTKISLKIQLENKIFPIDGLCCCRCLFVNGKPLRRLFVDWALHSAEVRWRCTTVTMFFDDAWQCRCSLTTQDSADVRWRCTTVPMFFDDARQCRSSLTMHDSADVRWRCTTVPMFADDARQCRCSLTMHDCAVCSRTEHYCVGCLWTEHYCVGCLRTEHYCVGCSWTGAPLLRWSFAFTPATFTSISLLLFNSHIICTISSIIVRFKLFTSLRIADNQIFRMHHNKL